MGFFAEGDPNQQFDDSVYENMKAPRAPINQAPARELFADAFGRAKLWQPNAKAATVGPTTIGRTDAASRGYQQTTADLLAAIAAGKGGGVAAPTMQAQLARGMAGNNAMMATRATSPNMLAGASMDLGNTNQGMAVNSQAKLNALAAQEQIAAEGALTPHLAGMRAQDMGVASEQAKLNASAGMANAGFANQTALENQWAQLMGDAFAQKALAAGAGYDRQMWENDMARERLRRGLALDAADANWRARSRENAATGEWLKTMGDFTAAGIKQNAGGA